MNFVQKNIFQPILTRFFTRSKAFSGPYFFTNAALKTNQRFWGNKFRLPKIQIVHSVGIFTAIFGSVSLYKYFDSCLVVFAQDEKKITADEEKNPSKTGFRDQKILNYENRIRFFSRLDKVFRYFATREYENEIFMTVEDFIRSIIPGELQPEGLGLDKFKKVDGEKIQRKFDEFKDDESVSLLQRFEKIGLISFPEYVFLLTALSTSPRRFEIAFKMFDLDGNGTVDLSEFQQVQSVIRNQTNSNPKRLRVSNLSPSESSAAEKTPTGEKNSSLAKSSLLCILFGKDGSKKITLAKFCQFLSTFQREILYQEFQKHIQENNENSPPNTISCYAFAKVLISYSSTKDSKEFRQRARLIRKNLAGKFISLDQFEKFNDFIKNIDDVEMILRMYSASGEPISKGDF
eukprot:Sdes_comp20446_c0_seq1m14631